MLKRSRTWHGSLRSERASPKREAPASKVDCQKCKKPDKVGRKVTTLSRHYYLEGGWGWVIVCVSVCVHVLSHGLQLAWPVLEPATARKFQTGFLETGNTNDN